MGRSGWTCALPDHPRSRGVYCGKEFVTRGNGGSSPLARGLLPGEINVHANVRIIPARAGFTLFAQ